MTRFSLAPGAVCGDNKKNMAQERILVVEDDEDILDVLRYNLEREGFVVDTCVRGDQVIESVARKRPGLILLDLMLPGLDGLDVCRRLRQDPATASIPVVMLTAKGEEVDVVAGLEVGADDYIPKPFSPKILLARLRAVLRRRQATPEPEAEPVIEIEGLVIDPARHRVRAGKQEIPLTATEFRLLYFLARHPGRVYTREQIVDQVKGEDYPVTDRSVDVQVVGLRRKLGSQAHVLETVRGVGYRFKDGAFITRASRRR